MKTGYLHIDGNAALGREPAVPHHWIVALTAVIAGQWIAWQGLSASPYLPWLISLQTGWDISFRYALANLFYLLVPMGLIGALALYLSRRIDGRGARALGLDRATAPLALIWSVAALVAAAPHIIALILRDVNWAELAVGFAVLTPVTIIQAGAEEILFRGVLLGFLCARYGVRNGVLISGLVFGLWHVYIGQPLVDAIALFASTFVFGVTASILTLHYGNLGPAIGLHVVWNVAGYLSGAAAVGDEFWSSWTVSFASQWGTEDIANGGLVRMLVIPLMIETLIIFAACRETVLRLFGAPEAARISSTP